MIKAKFTGPEGQILKTKLPCHTLSLDSDLRKIGAEMPSRFLKLSGGEDSTVRMELKPMNKVAGQLMESFSGTGTLEDLNCAAQAVVHANKQIKPQLEQAVLQGRYPSLDSLLDGIHQLTYDAGAASETYYFPLTGTIWERDSDEGIEVSDSFLLGYAEKIQERFATYMSGDTENMAFYYNGPGNGKLLLADWGFEVQNDILYGKVDARLAEPMDERESAALKDWISGQNSDGLGEGYEQQEIRTEEGDMYVSFWHSGEDYFVYTQEEMDQHLSQSYGQEFGGM